MSDIGWDDPNELEPRDEWDSDNGQEPADLNYGNESPYGSGSISRALPAKAWLTPEQLFERELKQLNRGGVPESRPNIEHVRVFLKAAAAAAGHELDALLAVVRPGRVSALDRPRHDALARIVAQLRERGVTQEQLGEAVGMPQQSISKLEARGRELLAQDERAKAREELRAVRGAKARRPGDEAGCRRHRDNGQSDCPACGRVNPGLDAWGEIESELSDG
jgi:hypothetical protein